MVMSTPSRHRRLSMQTKVLVPVLGVLVLLPALTLWIVDRHIGQQAQDEARKSLNTAEGFFRRSLDLQSAGLRARWRGVVNEPRFRAVLQLFNDDSKSAADTLTIFLRDNYAEDRDVAIVTNATGELQAGVRRDSSTVQTDQFHKATAGMIQSALTGEIASGSVRLEGRVLNVVAVPVMSVDERLIVGAFAVGVELKDAAIQELKGLTGTEIVLFGDGRILASTLRGAATDTVLQELMHRSEVDSSSDAVEVVPVLVAGEHFFAQSGQFDWHGAGRGFRYLLLSSYEQRLRELGDTRVALAGVSLAGIVVSGVLVWILVSRVTRPLRELRDTAEAVGKGDFTRRVTRFSNDECGDLAETFNHMTANLQSSLAELEKTVETLRTTQHQLIQSEKLSAVGQFVAGVAHELNNPLTAVIGFADLLSQTVADPELQPRLDLIARSAHRCHRIVQSLLSFARQHKPERGPVQITEAIDDVLELMAYDLRTSNIQVVREFDPALPLVEADPHQLQQVFINLLSNARQAIQPFRSDGRMIIRAKANGRMVRLEFQDNGPGISKENLSRIFDPFFTTKPVGKGTGLGLSLSYGIIREHGGSIHVESEPGEGAMFVIELPIAATQPGSRLATARPPSRRPFTPVGAGKSVLIVDDEEWIRVLVGELLEREGYSVEPVSSGEQAIAILRDRKFDLVLCDWKMPGMNGMRIFEHLLVNDLELAKRVLFMTGDVVNDTFEEFLRRHGRACLPKPFSINEFRTAVARATGAAT